MKRAITGATFYSEVMKMLQSGCPGTETGWICDGAPDVAGGNIGLQGVNRLVVETFHKRNSFREEASIWGNETAVQ
jgi:hypothetical protein